MSSPTGRPHTFEGRAAALAVRRPAGVLAVALAGLAVALGLAASHLELRSSNLDLIDPDAAPVRLFRAFAERFGTPNVLVVGLEGDDPEALRTVADSLAPRLAGLPGVRGVVHRLPYDRQVLGWHEIEPYFTSRDGGLLLLFVQPEDRHSSASEIAPFVEAVRREVAAARLDEGGIRAGFTGLPQYALDDRDTIRRDVGLLSGVAIVLVLALFAVAFGAFLRPVAAVVALVVAVGWTLGLAALYPGHLTLLSAFFASILFGLGIDFGIHVVDRVEERIGEGDPPDEAIVAAVDGVAPALRASAVTTAAAFFSLALSGFRGFRELGLIAGAGVLLCAVAMATVLPALLALLPVRYRCERRLDERRTGRLLLPLSTGPAAWALGLVAAGALLIGPPVFDIDYLNLQAEESEAVRLEREIVRRSGWSPQFAAFVVSAKEEVWDRVEALRQEETVGEIRSILDLDKLRYLPVVSAVEEAMLRSTFSSEDGAFAVYAYPAGDVWDRPFQDRFLDRMLRIDEEATGMPFLGRFMIERSQRALRRTAGASAAILVFLTLAAFRRWSAAAVALTPAVLGAGGMLGLMRLAGIDFNPLNVMALPVVLGIAVDDGIHLVHRFLAERGDLVRTLAGAGRSVVLTSATSIAAFGALTGTAHRGLASFAMALTAGVASALAVSLVVVPRLLEAWRGRILPAPDGPAGRARATVAVVIE